MLEGGYRRLVPTLRVGVCLCRWRTWVRVEWDSAWFLLGIVSDEAGNGFSFAGCDRVRVCLRLGEQGAKLVAVSVEAQGSVHWAHGFEGLANKIVTGHDCLLLRRHNRLHCVDCIDRTQCPIDVINLSHFEQTCKLLERWQRSCCAYVRVRDCACVDLVCWCGQGTGEPHGNKGQTGGRRGRISPYSANLLAGAACVTLCFCGFVLWCQS